MGKNHENLGEGEFPLNFKDIDFFGGVIPKMLPMFISDVWNLYIQHMVWIGKFLCWTCWFTSDKTNFPKKFRFLICLGFSFPYSIFRTVVSWQIYFLKQRWAIIISSTTRSSPQGPTASGVMSTTQLGGVIGRNCFKGGSKKTSWWLPGFNPFIFVNLDHFPKYGVKIKYVWNHHTENHATKYTPKRSMGRTVH